jgi:hypothetical protein
MADPFSPYSIQLYSTDDPYKQEKKVRVQEFRDLFPGLLESIDTEFRKLPPEGLKRTGKGDKYRMIRNPKTYETYVIEIQQNPVDGKYYAISSNPEGDRYVNTYITHGGKRCSRTRRRKAKARKSRRSRR